MEYCGTFKQLNYWPNNFDDFYVKFNASNSSLRFNFDFEQKGGSSATMELYGGQQLASYHGFVCSSYQ